VTLREHVSEQIAFNVPDPADRIVARELAEGLDEAGYLRADLAELAGRLGIDLDTVHRVLVVCQAFDPPGLFARDLAECLALQLAARDRLDPAMKALVANLDLLARRDFVALKRICRVDEEDLVDMMGEIRKLDPRPGLAFAGGVAGSIVPDVVVRQAGDGSWAVELNPETLPRVLVDQAYFARVSCLREDPGRPRIPQRVPAERQLADPQPRPARQDDPQGRHRDRAPAGRLPAHGVRHLRPLNLKTVAEAIGMHESTVSRVTANKYMLTPRGVFELRYFFTASIASAEGGEAHSSEAVRDHIRQPDRRGEVDRAVRRRHCGYPEEERRRHRPAHGGQVSGRNEHSLLRPASAREACHGRRRALNRPPEPAGLLLR
jgi:RNA polymerase sigma-54 factor